MLGPPVGGPSAIGACGAVAIRALLFVRTAGRKRMALMCTTACSIPWGAFEADKMHTARLVRWLCARCSIVVEPSASGAQGSIASNVEIARGIAQEGRHHPKEHQA